MEIKVLIMIFMQDDIPTWCSVIEIPVGNVVVVLLMVGREESFLWITLCLGLEWMN